MGIRDWFRQQFDGKNGNGYQPLPQPKEIPSMPKVKAPKLTPKELATKNGDPWVTVLGMDVNPENISEGNFELDFNDIFVAKLVKAGYSGKTDYDIVDQWFTEICRNIVLEQFEQEMADPDKRADWVARTANSLRPPPSFDN